MTRRLILSFAIFFQFVGVLPADQPIPIAHRGLLRHAPENTLPAFAACVELRIGFELDIRTTKDGHLVVIHDDNVMRTTDGPSTSVRNLTLEQLKRLDAGSWFDEAFEGVRVPTLEETLAMVNRRRRGPTIIAINIKDVSRDGEAQLVALVAKYELLDESFAFDQNDDVSRRLKELNPAFQIGQNVPRKEIDARLHEGLLDCFLLTAVPVPGEVERLHKRGKKVLFNYAGAGKSRRRAESWRLASAAGIDGMLTDYPLDCRDVWRKTETETSDGPPLDPRGVWIETPWGKPVIDRGATGAWDHLAVDNPYIYVEDNRLYCFYEAQDKPFRSGGREAIGIATSDDGVTWRKQTNNPILSTGDEGAWDHIVAKLPAGVIKRNGRYYLFYSGLNSQTKQIGLATASKLSGTWTKSLENPVLKSRSDEWDHVLSTHPAPIFEVDGRFHLLFRGMKRRYSQQGLGVAVSTDLVQWARLQSPAAISTSEEIASLAVAKSNGRFVAISQPLDLSRRSYWFSEDLKRWTRGPAVNFRASTKAETLSNPFLLGGTWNVLYEQQDRIYRAVLQIPVDK